MSVKNIEEVFNQGWISDGESLYWIIGYNRKQPHLVKGWWIEFPKSSSMDPVFSQYLGIGSITLKNVKFVDMNNHKYDKRLIYSIFNLRFYGEDAI